MTTGSPGTGLAAGETDYTRISLSDVTADCAAIAAEARAVFGELNGEQLNWRPDAGKWSIAQCFEHLINADREMFQAIDAALDASAPRSVWQRMPLLPSVFGRLLITSQMPQTTRKYTAPQRATPSSSAIDDRVIERFIALQGEAIARTRRLAERQAARVIVVSPFVRFITYSVLDAYRLVAAHQRRHFEQARRVLAAPGFAGRV